ncbi:alkylation response protein AidB-like acyl-CoA dehydrogenase [Nocardioides zeae]|uniref:Alkylation response protein AidB-like acyl-CoA dehydrogenase n=1 Tax=Nocardioides zeae TaxID=1457234 RepID=A0ACC6ILQ2_9ACTN|nr:acyl-CoA dehydrogenase family protein [Nocardioides zeae]MDR6175030.1 alkylation response protein AidB-like acyl-CoA dehydrogenase [Nocardioides zeae]MDR6211608.1 alkylation response protein AidB-like acyl-CoA dehydrogenase [Nocardioides zeae]
MTVDGPRTIPDGTRTGAAGQPRTLAAALPRIRAVLADLAVGAGERDLRREHPYAGVRALADAGFGRLRVPAEHGGFDVDLPTLVGLLVEAGQADSNLPQIWRGHFTATEILRQEVDAEARRHWFAAIADGAVFGNAQSEPSTVPGAEPTTTRVRVAADGVRLVSGRKFYSTGARFADYVRAAVVHDDDRRGFVVVPARHPGVTHVDDWDGVGQRQTGSGTTLFDDVPVEPHGDVGGFREALRGLDSFVQLVHLANLVGIARDVLAETTAVVRSRTRTSLHALSQDATSDPEVLGVVGRIHTRVLTAEGLLRTAVEALEEAHAVGEEAAYSAAYVVTSSAQVGVIEAVLDAATTAFDAGGSSAVREQVHLDRHWRNARTLASHNPVVHKPRIVGDHVVNGRTPEPGYYRDRRSLDDADAPVDRSQEGAL